MLYVIFFYLFLFFLQKDRKEDLVGSLAACVPEQPYQPTLTF